MTTKEKTIPVVTATKPNMWAVYVTPNARVCTSTANHITDKVFGVTFDKDSWTKCAPLKLGVFTKDVAETLAERASLWAFTLMAFCACGSKITFTTAQE